MALNVWNYFYIKNKVMDPSAVAKDKISAKKMAQFMENVKRLEKKKKLAVKRKELLEARAEKRRQKDANKEDGDDEAIEKDHLLGEHEK